MPCGFTSPSLQIPYRVQYMAVAGGNAFYRKTGPALRRYPLRAERHRIAWPRLPLPSVNQAALAETPRGKRGRALPRPRQRARTRPAELRCCEKRAWARSLSPARTRPPAASARGLDAKKPPGISPRRLSSHYVANQLVEEGTRSSRVLDEGSGSPKLRASSARQWRNVSRAQTGQRPIARVQRRPSLVSLATTYSPAS